MIYRSFKTNNLDDLDTKKITKQDCGICHEKFIPEKHFIKSYKPPKYCNKCAKKIPRNYKYKYQDLRGYGENMWSYSVSR